MKLVPFSRTSTSLLGTGALALALAGCGGGEPMASAYQIENIITGVSTADGTVQAVLVDGPAPDAGAIAAPSVGGISAVVNGGSATINVGSGGTFNRMILAMASVDGYYELTLPAGVSAQDIILNVAPAASGASLHLRYATGSGVDLSAYAAQVMRLIRVGTGDVQVSVAWTGATDVDLHVLDPTGFEVYFGERVAPTGGRLDLDSNAACSIDNVNNENIVWPTNAAPAGAYTVVVDYWSDCQQPRSDYVVTVQVRGQQPRTYTGSFVGVASGVPNDTVATFTY